VGLESTIVSCLESSAALLRPGGITREQLEATLGEPLEKPGKQSEKPVAPGQLSSHYAPRAPLRLNARAVRPGEAWLGFGEHQPHEAGMVLNLSSTGDLRQAAANLFAMLHQLDALEPACIAVAPVPEQGLGLAINDRLRRAAAPRE
jgi:L-threonylcarbamoyladenylate synthase